MENAEQQAFVSFDPDESEGDIEQVRLEGWVKIQSHRGQVQVLKVKTVRLLDRWALEVVRPGREGFPLYKGGFLWNSIERIPEEEALAFLARQGARQPRSAEKPPPEDGEHQ